LSFSLLVLQVLLLS